MQTPQEYILLLLNSIRCIPHLIMYYFHKNRSIIRVDVKRGLKNMEKEFKDPLGLLYLLTFCKEYRNLFYYRTRPLSSLLNLICPQMSSLHIHSKNIGEGFVIVHGVASEIGPESLGKNCTIYHQVTIGGATNYGAPVIKDNVTVYAGAVVIGKITIGNNVVIGANATVFSNIPDDCTVLPGTSKIMRWKKRST